MELSIKITGILLICLAMLHGVFPRYFNWKKDLAGLSLINRQMMIVHTFFIALTVGLMGLLCISSAHELVSTSLGKKISLGLAVFWMVRLVIQFVGYSPALWKGKRFETIMHILFTLLWIYLSGIFLAAFLFNK